MSVKDVFLDLVSYPTASDETTGTTPSTPGQKVLGAHIVEHMKSIGIADARMDEMGYVYGTIPATAERGTTVGFIATWTPTAASAEKISSPRSLKITRGTPSPWGPAACPSPLRSTPP